MLFHLFFIFVVVSFFLVLTFFDFFFVVIIVGFGVLVAGLVVIDEVANNYLAGALDNLHEWATTPRTGVA